MGLVQVMKRVGGPIADCQLPIGVISQLAIDNPQSAIGNRQSSIVAPTRYREVVLTS
jgi:hypothetical protein